jgi:hypothetical protein
VSEGVPSGGPLRRARITYGDWMIRRSALVLALLLAACGHDAKPKTPPGSTATVSTPETTTTSLLTAVRVAHNGNADRVVFEFRSGDPIPGYKVGYGQRPIVEDPSGKGVDVSGDNVVTVRMAHASGYDLTKGDAGGPTYTGAKRIAGPGSPVVEAVESGDFEGILNWVIGVKGRPGLRVSTLSAPPRVVIDVTS